jgi:hypothetical protein
LEAGIRDGLARLHSGKGHRPCRRENEGGEADVYSFGFLSHTFHFGVGGSTTFRQLSFFQP